MNGKLLMSLTALMLYPPASGARGIDDIITSLKSPAAYHTDVDYSVLMSLQDDVNYRIQLQSWATPGDTLAPCDYLIDWTLATPDGSSHGFSAYYDGHVYSFRGDRLLEYHYENDSIQFIPRGRGAASLPGIQRRAQFSELLPEFIASQLEEIRDNPDYRYTVHNDTVVDGTKVTAIDGTMEMNGQVLKEFIYLLDKTSAMPLKVNLENNPGALAEQSITATYTYSADIPAAGGITEERLRAIYPEIFERYRESNFAIEKLPGQRLPSFALPTTTGERHTHMLGEKFRAPTIVVLLDPGATFARPTVSAVRSAAASLPFNADIIWAFVSNNVDEIESIVPRPDPGEHLLMSCKPLARDCGVSSYPAIIICKTDGTVADVALGYNNNLATIVIQKTALAVK